MDSPNPRFQFVNETEWQRPPESLCVEIPANLGCTDELFSVLEERLRLPGYSGRNWNALSDLLRDMHWVEQRTVILLHKALPNLGSADSANYLSVLAEAAADWKPDEPHELVVVFPESLRVRILQLLQSSRDQ